MSSQNIQTIPFNRALTALREGNPRPMLSEKVEFPSEELGSFWSEKAARMRDAVDTPNSPSIRAADKIKEVFVDDADTRNVALAKEYYRKFLTACSAMPDEKYAELLKEFVPVEEVRPDTVERSRDALNHIVAHIERLLSETEAL